MPDPGIALALGMLVVALVIAVLLPDRGLVARWRRARPRPADVLRQDALKFALQRETEQRPATVDDLASSLGVDPAGGAAIVAGLSQSGMLIQTGGEIRLSPTGREQAAHLIRAHRLWERHLADRTGFSETEWHELADREEHRLTPEQAEALARSLGQPARDPHGDPIPTAQGRLVPHPGIPLRTVAPGTTARITHIEDEPGDVYRLLIGSGLTPGATVQVIAADPARLRIRANGDEVQLPMAAAENVAVLPEPIERPPVGRPLSSLHPGERGVVVELSPRCRGTERRRMLDLGILPGTVIEAALTGPGGDPTAYRIRDALIALRRTQAELIRIEADNA